MSRLGVAAGSVAGFVLGGAAGVAASYYLTPSRSQLKDENIIGFGVLGAAVGATLLATAVAGCPEPKQLQSDPRFP